MPKDFYVSLETLRQMMVEQVGLPPVAEVHGISLVRTGQLASAIYRGETPSPGAVRVGEGWVQDGWSVHYLDSGQIVQATKKGNTSFFVISQCFLGGYG